MSVAERPETSDEAPRTRRGVGGWLRSHRGVAEFGIVGGCLLIYFLIRANVVDEPTSAFRHAEDIIGLEKRLGIFWEPSWQNVIRHHSLQVQWWNFVYFWWHAPVIAAVAFWLFFRHRATYSLIRNAFLVSCLIGLVMYALYPVTPPRLMTPGGYAEYHVQPPQGDATPPNYGFEDTLKDHSAPDYQAESLKLFVNPFAAMPSLHFGWSFLIAVAMALGWRNWFGKLAGVVMTVSMFFAVVLTANHFILDTVVGLAVCLIGLLAAVAYTRISERSRRRFTPSFLLD